MPGSGNSDPENKLLPGDVPGSLSIPPGRTSSPSKFNLAQVLQEIARVCIYGAINRVRAMLLEIENLFHRYVAQGFIPNKNGKTIAEKLGLSNDWMKQLQNRVGATLLWISSAIELGKDVLSVARDLLQLKEQGPIIQQHMESITSTTFPSMSLKLGEMDRNDDRLRILWIKYRNLLSEKRTKQEQTWLALQLVARSKLYIQNFAQAMQEIMSYRTVLFHKGQPKPTGFSGLLLKAGNLRGLALALLERAESYVPNEPAGMLAQQSTAESHTRKNLADARAQLSTADNTWDAVNRALKAQNVSETKSMKYRLSELQRSLARIAG